MRVLQINSVCGVGSTGRIATDIHSMLIQKGYESYIAYGRDLPKNCTASIKIGTKLDNYIHVALTRALDKHGFGSIKATRNFIKKVDQLDPDIIHLHNIHGYYINIKVLFDYLKKSGKPVIWTLHDCWSFTGHCAYFDYAGCNKWTTGCHNCPEKSSYPASIFFDNSRVNYQMKKEIFTGVKDLTIVTPSKWLANLVKQSYLKEYPVKVINNGIDLEVFKPTQSDFRKKYNLENKFIILGVANVWGRRKGFKYFIELSEKIKNDEAIVMVGLSKKQKESLPKNIIGITKTNNVKELAEIYTAADVFVNPTLEEVMGLTNVEALACGTPVITFDTGGSVECINKNTGIIVEKGNINQLKKAIEEIGSKTKLYNSKICTEIAIKNYNKMNNFLKYCDLFKNNYEEMMLN